MVFKARISRFFSLASSSFKPEGISISDASFLWHLIITVRLKHRGGCKIIMKEEMGTKSNISNNSMKITVLMNGPYMVTGRVPLITSEICKDEDCNRLIWREVKKYPQKEQYLYADVAIQGTNLSVTEHMQRFTLMEPSQDTMNPIVKV
jgi:hypothetical protein